MITNSYIVLLLINRYGDKKIWKENQISQRIDHNITHLKKIPDSDASAYCVVDFLIKKSIFFRFHFYFFKLL